MIDQRITTISLNGVTVAESNYVYIMEYQDLYSSDQTRSDPILLPQSYRYKENLRGSLLGKERKRSKMSERSKELSTEGNSVVRLKTRVGV